MHLCCLLSFAYLIYCFHVQIIVFIQFNRYFYSEELGHRKSYQLPNPSSLHQATFSMTAVADHAHRKQVRSNHGTSEKKGLYTHTSLCCGDLQPKGLEFQDQTMKSVDQLPVLQLMQYAQCQTVQCMSMRSLQV